MTVIDLNCPVFTVFDGATDQKKSLVADKKRERKKKGKKKERK